MQQKRLYFTKKRRMSRGDLFRLCIVVALVAILAAVVLQSMMKAQSGKHAALESTVFVKNGAIVQVFHLTEAERQEARGIYPAFQSLKFEVVESLLAPTLPSSLNCYIGYRDAGTRLLVVRCQSIDGPTEQQVARTYDEAAEVVQKYLSHYSPREKGKLAT